jgi:hypothetical protein
MLYANGTSTSFLGLSLKHNKTLKALKESLQQLIEKEEGTFLQNILKSSLNQRFKRGVEIQ